MSNLAHRLRQLVSGRHRYDEAAFTDAEAALLLEAAAELERLEQATADMRLETLAHNTRRTP